MQTSLLNFKQTGFIIGGVTSAELEEAIWEKIALVMDVSHLSDILAVTVNAKTTKNGKLASR